VCQSYQLQCRHFSLLHVHSAREGCHVRDAHVVSAAQLHPQCCPHSPLGLQHILSGRARLLRPGTSNAGGLVHCKKLQCCLTVGQLHQLHDGQGCIRNDLYHVVSLTRIQLSGTCIYLSSRAIFFANFVLSIWSMIPTKEQLEERKAEKEDRLAHIPVGMRGSPASETSQEKPWEMGSVPRASMRQPYTPRTLAFNTLDRQLPLRAQYK
jgi:hypothetical protein